MPVEALIISCEHASAAIPARWRHVFDNPAVVRSHLGWDPGALRFARFLSRTFDAPLHAGSHSRLLIDLNRSLHHPKLFSAWTKALPRAEREGIIRRYYAPWRDDLESTIEAAIGTGQGVLHISVHSFTPDLDDQRRHCDFGLLYDPQRIRERDLATAWQQRWRDIAPGLRLRRNYPYRGIADGCVTAMRRRFPENRYRGFEFEINQALVAQPGKWRQLCSTWQRLLALAEQSLI